MKKQLLNAFVALGLIATIAACSKDELAVSKPVTSSAHPLDPGNYGYYQIETGEIYYYNEGITDYSEATKHYLQLNSLRLEKYKNGAFLDSVCNQDIAFYFESKALKTYNKSALWGVVPQVTAEHTPIVTVNTNNYIFSIKTSKMVTGVGFEINSPYRASEIVGIHVSYWNSKLNKEIPRGGGTRYLAESVVGLEHNFGEPGGANIWGLESPEPFDEVRIRFEYLSYGAPPPPGPFEISFAGFRYKLAK